MTKRKPKAAKTFPLDSNIAYGRELSDVLENLDSIIRQLREAVQLNGYQPSDLESLGQLGAAKEIIGDVFAVYLCV